MAPLLLTRYEVARIVGLRALQLDAGAAPLVAVARPRDCDATYVAARELDARVLDVAVRRAGGALLHVRDAAMPPELYAMLDVADGGARRPFCGTGAPPA